MYNILTCDDEQIMIDSLQFIIKKNFEGQVNLFSALSGSDAVSIVSREKIDIIFMDINILPLFLKILNPPTELLYAIGLGGSASLFPTWKSSYNKVVYS